MEHGAHKDAQDVQSLYNNYSYAVAINIVLQFQHFQWTGLILSSRRGDLDIVKKLLDQGADIHKSTNV